MTSKKRKQSAEKAIKSVEVSQAKLAQVAEPDPEDQCDPEPRLDKSRNLGSLLQDGLTGLAVKIALVRQGHHDLISSKCLLGIASLLAESD